MRSLKFDSANFQSLNKNLIVQLILNLTSFTKLFIIKRKWSLRGMVKAQYSVVRLVPVLLKELAFIRTHRKFIFLINIKKVTGDK